MDKARRRIEIFEKVVFNEGSNDNLVFNLLDEKRLESEDSRNG